MDRAPVNFPVTEAVKADLMSIDAAIDQMSSVMAFLNSDAASGVSGVSGVSLLVDSGQVMATTAGALPADRPLIDLLMGRE